MDDGVLETVDELSEGDILVVVEDVDGLEGAVGTVAEPEPQELTSIRRGSAAKLDSESRAEVGNGGELGVLLDNTGLVEEGDEGLVGGLDEHELEGVIVEGNALESLEDGAQSGSASNVADAVDALVTEDGVLTEVSKSTGLLEEGRGKTVSVSLVVDELRGNVVVDIEDVLHVERTTEDEVPQGVEEGLSLLFGITNLVGLQDVLDVLLERRAVGPGFQRAVVDGLNGLNRDVLVTAEGSNDGGLVGQGDAVLGGGRVETLEDGGSTVEDSSTLATNLDTGVNLLEVSEVGGDATDVGGRVRVEVGLAQEATELVSLNLAQRCSGGRRCLVGDGVVGALSAVTVSGNHDDTVNLGVSHGGGVVDLFVLHDGLFYRVQSSIDGVKKDRSTER